MGPDLPDTQAPQPSSQPTTSTPSPPPTTQVVTSQVSPTSQSSEMPSSGAGRKPSIKILAVASGIIAIVLVIGIVAFLFLRKPNYPVYEVYLPQNVPIGFSQTEGVQTEINQSGNRVFLYEFSHPSKGSFLLSQEENGVLDCQTPPADSELLTNYASFDPLNSQGGCALTINKETGDSLRSYRWLANSTKFIIIVYDSCINDAIALDFANFLRREKVEVGEVIEK